MRNGHSGRRRAAFLRNLTAQGERVAERVQALGHEAFNRAARAVRGAKRAKKRVRTYVTGNPITSVLIAMGLGAVVGYLLHRRPRQD